MSHAKNKWVIVFLIYADFRRDGQELSNEPFAMSEEMKVALNCMLGDILTTPLNPDNARLFVIMNGINYKASDTNDLFTESKTLFYPIVNTRGSGLNQFGTVEIVDSQVSTTNIPNPENPFQRKDFLKNILNKISVEQDEEVFLMTWDHGSAFGIFRENDPEIATPVTSIENNLDKYPYLKMFWDKALEEHPEFRSFIEKQKENSKPLFQIGMHFFKINDRSTSKSFIQDVNSKKVESIGFKLNRADHNSSKLVLVKDTQKDQLLIAEENSRADHGNMEIVAELNGEKVREILLNKELADVIKYWLKGKKLAVLLMMNCWMMNLHTMYSLRKRVKCLVAPQSDIGTPGYNYKEILKYIYQNCITPQDLAIICVKKSENKRAHIRAGELRSDFPNIIDSWKIFAADLEVSDVDGKSLLSKQLCALKEFIDILNMPSGRRDSKENKWMYKYVRSVCFDFSNNICMMVDIVNWCLSLQYANEDFSTTGNDILNGKVEKAIQNVRDRYLRNKKQPSIILRKTEGKLVYTIKDGMFEPTAVIGLEPTGYSLFFPLFNLDPSRKHEYAGVIDNVQKDELLKWLLKDWKVFLQSNIDASIEW